MIIFLYLLLALYLYIAFVTYKKEVKILTDKKKCLKMAIKWPIDFFKEWIKTVQSITSDAFVKINMMGKK